MAAWRSLALAGVRSQALFRRLAADSPASEGRIGAWLRTSVCLAGPSLGAYSTQGRTPIEQEVGGSPFTPARPGTLTLRSRDVDVVINNGFATTTVEQPLDNPTDTSLEATWSFPLPDDASLSELALWIDGAPQVGEVVEKDAAKRIYGSEKESGESSALAEQNGFIDYRVSVIPVPARGEVRGRIVYFQPLDVDLGLGRYLYPLQGGNTDSLNRDQSFWSMEKSVTDRMTIDVTLKTASPIDGLHSPSHSTITTTQESERLWHCSWSGSGAALETGFLLLYRLREDVPARIERLTGRYAGQGEGTFMAVITPGEDLTGVPGVPSQAPIRRSDADESEAKRRKCAWLRMPATGCRSPASLSGRRGSANLEPTPRDCSLPHNTNLDLRSWTSSTSYSSAPLQGGSRAAS